jgi:uncharacterized protein (TIGR02301 family)
MIRRLGPGLLTAFVLGTAAHAQDRPPEDRQTLTDLAYVIGQAHAVRQVCEGADDQYWRARMMRLSEVEAADAAFDAQLKERFNAGFATGQAEQPVCGPASHAALAKLALKGQGLAAKLATLMRPTARPPVDDPYAVKPPEKPATSPGQ